jgi:hypothetical protein
MNWISGLGAVVVGVVMVQAFSPVALGQEDASAEFRQGRSSGVFDLTFKGGTVGEYAAGIRNVLPGANIIVMPAAEPLPVPAVTLKSVDIHSALALLDQHDAMIDGQRWVLSIRDTMGAEQAATPIYTLMAYAAGGKAADPDAMNIQAAVLSISSILEGGHIQSTDALTAVETALALFAGDGGGPKPQLKFHEETGLLIVRGTREQVSIIHQVVDQLGETAITLEAFAQRRAGVMGETERTQLEERIRLSEDMVDSAQQEIIVLQTRNQVLEDELNRARSELAEREAAFRDLSTRVHMLEVELSQKTTTKP